MLISSRTIAAGLAGALALMTLGTECAFAFDGSPSASDQLQAVSPAAPEAIVRLRSQPYRNAGDALRQGVQEYHRGDKAKAARALEYAADDGNVLAQWKLGSMYAGGDGIGHDDYMAFRYFSRIADANSDIGPESPNAPAVAKAFVALGNYYLTGIKNSPIKPNPNQAHMMYQSAAALLADSDGQYHLGRLYLDGALGQRDTRRAAQWLNLSAEKGHPLAMAVLGNLLIAGDEAVPRQVPKGLMWLELAKSKVGSNDMIWVLNLYNQAQAQATDEQRALSHRFMAQQTVAKK